MSHNQLQNVYYPGVIMILDLWHPELTDPEVKFFEMLLKSKLKGDKFMSDKIDN